MEAYGTGLKAFDDYLPLFQDAMDDATREHIPVLLWHQGITPGPAGIRETFGDVGATILRALGAPAPKVGTSIL